MLISLIIDLISRGYARMSINNLILLNVLSFAEVSFFSFFYFSLGKNKKVPVLLGSVGFLYVIFEFINFEDQSVALFQSYSKVVVAFLIVIMSMNYIITQISKGKEIENRILNLGILFFFSMEFILLLPLNYLINYYSEIVGYLWLFRVSVIIIFYLILIHFLWNNGEGDSQIHLQSG